MDVQGDLSVSGVIVAGSGVMQLRSKFSTDQPYYSLGNARQTWRMWEQGSTNSSVYTIYDEVAAKTFVTVYPNTGNVGISGTLTVGQTVAATVFAPGGTSLGAVSYFAGLGTNTSSLTVLGLLASHASYASTVLFLGTVRAANAAFTLIDVQTGETAAGGGGTSQFMVNGVGNTTVNGTLTVSSTTDGTAGNVGAINTAGGIGVTKAAWVGTTLTVVGTGQSQLTGGVAGLLTTLGQFVVSAPASKGYNVIHAIAGDTFTGNVFHGGTVTAAGTGFNLLVLRTGMAVDGSVGSFGFTIDGTGQLQAKSGSAALPIYSFTGDLDTGIYSSAANTLQLVTGGTIGLTVSSDQAVIVAGLLTAQAGLSMTGGTMTLSGQLNFAPDDTYALGGASNRPNLIRVGTGASVFGGTLTVNGISATISNNNAGTGTAGTYLAIVNGNNNGDSFLKLSNQSIDWYMGNIKSSSNLILGQGSNFDTTGARLTLTSGGNATIAGTLTVNGTGTSTFNGNVTITKAFTGDYVLRILNTDTAANRPSALLIRVNTPSSTTTDPIIKVDSVTPNSTYLTLDSVGNLSILGTLTVNGAKILAGANGSSTAPFYTWAGRTDVGMYSPAANHLRFAPGGNASYNGQMGVFHTGEVTDGGATPTVDLPFSYGLIIIYDEATGTSAIYYIKGSGTAPTEISDVDGKYSPTVNTASSTNIYNPSGTTIRIQNKTGSTTAYIVFHVGA